MQNKLFLLQTTIVVLCAVVVWVYMGEDAALAAGYGGVIALVNAWLMVRRVTRASQLAEVNPTSGTFTLYFGAVERFVFVLVGMGVGLGYLRLDPLPLLATFALAQVTYIIAAGKQAAAQS
jgi:ATP synthase protein I